MGLRRKVELQAAQHHESGSFAFALQIGGRDVLAAERFGHAYLPSSTDLRSGCRCLREYMIGRHCC